jgi:hypothetical protein
VVAPSEWLLRSPPHESLPLRLGLAVVDMREAVYRDDVPETVEIIDLRSTTICPAEDHAPDLAEAAGCGVFDLGHLNLALAMLRSLLPNGVRYIGREGCVVSETLTEYSHPRLWARAYGRVVTRVLMSWYASLWICGTISSAISLFRWLRP